MASSSSTTSKHFSCVGVKTSPNLMNGGSDVSIGLSPAANNNNQVSFSFTSPSSFSFVHSNSSPSFLEGDSQQGSGIAASNSTNTATGSENTRNVQKRTPKKSPTKKSTCSKNIFNISLSASTGDGATAMNGVSFKFPQNTTVQSATTTPSLFNTKNTETFSTSRAANPTTLKALKNTLNSVVSSNGSVNSFQLNSPGFAPPKFGGSVISVPTFAAPTATFSSHSTRQSSPRNGASSSVQNGFSHNESVSSNNFKQPSLFTTPPSVDSHYQDEHRETSINSPILRPATFTPPKNSPTIFRGFGVSNTTSTSLNNTWVSSNASSITPSRTTSNGFLNSSPSSLPHFGSAAATTITVNGFSNSASSTSYRAVRNGFLSSSSSSSISSSFVEPRKPENQDNIGGVANSNLPRPESPLFQYSRNSTLSPSVKNFDFAKDGKEWHSNNNSSFFNPNAVKKKDSKNKDGRSSRPKHRSKENDTKTTKSATTDKSDNSAVTTTTTSTNLAITDKTRTSNQQQNVVKEISTLNNSVREFKVLLRELNGIRAFNDMRTISMMIESLEKNIRSVRECFKCEICFVSQYNHFFFCPDCGRMVGCFLCAYRLDRCPTCRKRLPPKKNRSPHVIPGLAAAMDEKELSRDELWKQVEKIRV